MILRHSAPVGRCLLVLSLIVASCFMHGVHAIGINYGTVANDLPPPDQVVQLLKTTYLSKVKLYEADPTILAAFAGSGYEIVVGVKNDLIQPIAASPSFAQQWITANVAAFYPATNIVLIDVGNEVLTTDQNSTADLVSAMQNLQTGLVNLGLSNNIKVTTPHSFAVLGTSYPPSDGMFDDVFSFVLTPLLAFLAQTGAPFMINAYPYFAYANNPTLDINYALFQPNAGVSDSNTGLFYTNLFDAQVDAAYAALAKYGYQSIPLIVSESGWPSVGSADEVGVSIANAQIYNTNLLKHLNSNAGTPAKPGVQVDTYLFALFNENLKPGPVSEQNFGLFFPNQAVVYNVGIQTGMTPPAAPGPYTQPPSAPAPYIEPPPSTPAPWSQPPPSPLFQQPPAAPVPWTEPPPAPAPWTEPPAAPTPYTPAPPYTAPPIIPAPPPPYPVPHSPALPTPTPPSQWNSPPPPTGWDAPPPPLDMLSPPPPPPDYTLSPPPPVEMTFPPPLQMPSPPPPPDTLYPPTAPPPPSFFNPPPTPIEGTPPYFPLSPPPPDIPEVPPPPMAEEPTEAPPQPPPGVPPAPPGTPSGPNTWCISKPGSSIADLSAAMDFACGEGGADCTAIQPGGPCYEPDTLFSRCSYAFSSYYAKNGRNYWNCFFGNVSLTTITDPSYGSCTYP